MDQAVCIMPMVPVIKEAGERGCGRDMAVMSILSAVFLWVNGGKILCSKVFGKIPPDIILVILMLLFVLRVPVILEHFREIINVVRGLVEKNMVLEWILLPTD